MPGRIFTTDENDTYRDRSADGNCYVHFKWVFIAVAIGCIDKPLLQPSGKGYTGFALSVHLPVCGQNHVCSASSTIPDESSSYLHIFLSSNFRRCVACQFFLKSKIWILILFFISWLSTSCSDFLRMSCCIRIVREQVRLAAPLSIYVWFWPLTPVTLILWIFKAKFQNSYIPGMVGLIDMGWKGYELIWCWTFYTTFAWLCPWPWPWILKFWNSLTSGTGGLIATPHNIYQPTAYGWLRHPSQW